MSIKMVRQPSDTPNITNIDDIIGMRYAYGNQNGYVIGKGTELDSVISGVNFTIGSGRVVLQGVECDIDASGFTLSVDPSISTKRYYIVYLEINLGQNIANIKNTYDTVSYPVLDTGVDLTSDSNGIARLLLYKFTAINGIISDVSKVVNGIQYTNNIKVNNAVNSDNAIVNSDGSHGGFTQNENNVLSTTSGEIIEKKQVLWSGAQIIEAGGEFIFPLSSIPTNGDLIRIRLKSNIIARSTITNFYIKVIPSEYDEWLTKVETEPQSISGNVFHITSIYVDGIKAANGMRFGLVKHTTINFEIGSVLNTNANEGITVYEIAKIID